MIDIYQTWVEDFGIDGFRIDTMKHVNDEFWQQFGPGHAVDTPTADGKPGLLHVRRGRARRQRRRPRRASPRTTRPTTRCRRSSTSRSRTPPAASPRKGLGNQRLGAVLRQRRLVHRRATPTPTAADLPRQPRHGPDRLLPQDRQPRRRRRRAARARPARPRADVLLARQPGRLLRRRAGLHRHGGDQLARQTMFASQVPEYQDDDQIGTDRTRADDNFVTDHPLYRAIADLAALTDRAPGAAQRRAAGALRLRRRRASSRSRGSTARSSASTSSCSTTASGRSPPTCRRTSARAASPGCTAPGRPRLTTDARPQARR